MEAFTKSFHDNHNCKEEHSIWSLLAMTDPYHHSLYLTVPPAVLAFKDGYGNWKVLGAYQE